MYVWFQSLQSINSFLMISHRYSDLKLQVVISFCVTVLPVSLAFALHFSVAGYAHCSLKLFLDSVKIQRVIVRGLDLYVCVCVGWFFDEMNKLLRTIFDIRYKQMIQNMQALYIIQLRSLPGQNSENNAQRYKRTANKQKHSATNHRPFLFSKNDMDFVLYGKFGFCRNESDTIQKSFDLNLNLITNNFSKF